MTDAVPAPASPKAEPEVKADDGAPEVKDEADDSDDESSDDEEEAPKKKSGKAKAASSD